MTYQEVHRPLGQRGTTETYRLVRRQKNATVGYSSGTAGAQGGIVVSRIDVRDVIAKIMAKNNVGQVEGGIKSRFMKRAP